MRTILLAVFICFASTLAQAQIYVAQHNSLPFQDTSKRIASMRSTRYRATMVNGKLVKGQKTDEAVFFYDKHGNLAKRIIVFPVKDGKYQYRPGESPMTMQHAFDDSATVVNKCVYDERGNLIELPHDPLIYSMSGTFSYNNHNQITQLKQYNHYKGEALDRIQTYKYNDKDKLIERTEFSAQNKLLAKTTLDYDNAGRMVQVINADSTHIVSRTKLIYDSLTGKLMHLVLITDDGRLPLQYDYEYDEHDRKAKIFVAYNASKQLYSWFKYNAHDAGYQYTERNSSQTIVQTISQGLKKRETFEGEHPRDIQEWQYDKHCNVTQHSEAYYPLPPRKIEPINITVVVNEIKYRGGIFNRIGMLFKHKPYPPRFSAM